jgi:hypothetical protein
MSQALVLHFAFPFLPYTILPTPLSVDVITLPDTMTYNNNQNYSLFPPLELGRTDNAKKRRGGVDR